MDRHVSSFLLGDVNAAFINYSIPEGGAHPGAKEFRQQSLRRSLRDCLNEVSFEQAEDIAPKELCVRRTKRRLGMRR